MSRSISHCPRCEDEIFDEVPCSRCGYAPGTDLWPKVTKPPLRPASLWLHHDGTIRLNDGTPATTMLANYHADVTNPPHNPLPIAVVSHKMLAKLMEQAELGRNWSS